MCCVHPLCREPVFKPSTLSAGYRHCMPQASLATGRGTASAEVCYRGKQMLPQFKVIKCLGKKTRESSSIEDSIFIDSSSLYIFLYDLKLLCQYHSINHKISCLFLTRKQPVEIFGHFYILWLIFRINITLSGCLWLWPGMDIKVVFTYPHSLLKPRLHLACIKLSKFSYYCLF